MSYNSYATQINNKLNELNSIFNNISSLGLESLWEGNAATKQIGNLEILITEKQTQITNMETLASLLSQIDQYDNVKKTIEDYENKINNLNKEDINYQEKYNNLISLKNNSKNEYASLKQQIEDLLSKITTRYSEQYVDLSPTNIVNTANLFLESEKSLASINDSFKIITTYSDKTSSPNAGTILSIDKEGTILEKEPTPGKRAQELHVYHNGERLYNDTYITIKKGETIRLTVNLSNNAGDIKLLKRTTASGQGDKGEPEYWGNFFSAHSEPFVNRYDKSTYLATNNFDWVITADKKTNGYVTLSQTTFHSTENAPEYKSMYRVHVKVIDDEESQNQ